MNGAVFFIWFQSNLHTTQDRHLGEFSKAEIAARQAVPSRVRFSHRLGATLARLRDAMKVEGRSLARAQ